MSLFKKIKKKFKNLNIKIDKIKKFKSKKNFNF